MSRVDYFEMAGTIMLAWGVHELWGLPVAAICLGALILCACLCARIRSNRA